MNTMNRFSFPLVLMAVWSCMFLTLLVLPAAYAMWRRQQVLTALSAVVPNESASTLEGAA